MTTTAAQSRGIRFSVDDFGTGYSNLAYLKKMPLYELKIDKSLMRDTPHDHNGTAIVQSILSMAGTSVCAWWPMALDAVVERLGAVAVT